jgi:hypothetical protein
MSLHVSGEMVSLAASLDRLRDYFNSQVDRVRFLALLSPT